MIIQYDSFFITNVVSVLPSKERLLHQTTDKLGIQFLLQRFTGHSGISRAGIVEDKNFFKKSLNIVNRIYVQENIDSETEKEIEIMNNSLGAEIRLLQLEKALLKNILKL